MSIDALLDALERDAQAEAAKLVLEAQQQADAILSRAAAEITRRRAEELDRLEEAGRRAVAAETAAVARRYREARLQERAEVLDRVFAEAEGDLGTAEAERYRDLLPGLLAATLRFMEDTPVVVHCRPEIADEIERRCAGHRDVAIRPAAAAAAGILGESADGAVAVDNTLPALLRRRRGELEVAVAARLEAM